MSNNSCCYIDSDTICKKQFLKRVLSDTGSFSPFIVINIIDSSGEHTSLVNSGELFRYLRKNYSIDFKRYLVEMTDLIISHKPLKLDKSLKGIFVINMSRSTLAEQIIAKGGIKALIDYHETEQSRLKDSYSLFGLELLFDNKYVIRRGDISVGFDLREFKCN
jgi:hypothetical protein